MSAVITFDSVMFWCPLTFKLHGLHFHRLTGTSMNTLPSNTHRHTAVFSNGLTLIFHWPIGKHCSCTGQRLLERHIVQECNICDVYREMLFFTSTKEVMLLVQFVALFVSRTTGLIFMKLGGRVYSMGTYIYSIGRNTLTSLVSFSQVIN